MTTEQFEQKKREFRKKYKAGYVLPEIINGTLEFKNKRDEFISDLNTLLAEYTEMILREELIAYDKWAMRHLNGAGEIFTTERAVDEYLKSKEQ